MTKQELNGLTISLHGDSWIISDVDEIPLAAFFDEEFAVTVRRLLYGSSIHRALVDGPEFQEEPFRK